MDLIFCNFFVCLCLMIWWCCDSHKQWSWWWWNEHFRFIFHNVMCSSWLFWIDLVFALIWLCLWINKRSLFFPHHFSPVVSTVSRNNIVKEMLIVNFLWCILREFKFQIHIFHSRLAKEKIHLHENKSHAKEKNCAKRCENFKTKRADFTQIGCNSGV